MSVGLSQRCVFAAVFVGCVVAAARAFAADGKDSTGPSDSTDDTTLEELPFTRWGVETLDRIDRDLSVGNVYAEWGTPDGKRHAEHGRVSARSRSR